MANLSSRQLSIPRSGMAKLILGATDPLRFDASQEITIAAWQTPEKGTPKRVVVRIDGHITNPLPAHDDPDDPAMPCGVVNVRYSIGGYVREVLVDAAGQSALTVWAETVDVTAAWDRRRITRILGPSGAYGYRPCIGQIVAASISAGADAGDQGMADARYLDAIAVDVVEAGPGGLTELSYHPIPFGARGMRFGNAFDTATFLPVSVPAIATSIGFNAIAMPPFPVIAPTCVQWNTNALTDTSILIIPATAIQVAIGFPTGTIAGWSMPSWVEFIMSPNSLPGN